MKTPSASDAVFAALVLWTLGATGFILRANRSDRASSSSRAPLVAQTAIPDWQQYAKGGYVVGPDTSQTTMVVFSDFQCPFCRKLSAVLDSVHERYPQVRLIERHFPIAALHPAAFKAAVAAECARDVGGYAAMRRTLFSNPLLVRSEQWGALALRAGLADTARLGACVKNEEHAAIVNEDIRAGTQLGVQATPTFLLNDSLYAGSAGFAQLEKRLRSNLASR